MSEQEKREFDEFASNYADLIRDPVRDRFAASSRFFAERKLYLFRDFFGRLKKDMHQLDWLDVGCGQGELLRLSQGEFKSAAGCDPSNGMLNFCSDLNVREQSSIDQLPYDNSRFDFITMVCVYHHVEIDRRPALTKEASRLLRPGGVLCIVEHNPWNPMTKLIVSRTPVDADAKLLSVRQTRRLMSTAGFKGLVSPFFLFLPERLYRVVPPLEAGLRFLPVGGQYAVFGRKE
jgi:SAM-dependent methyltransferase